MFKNYLVIAWRNLLKNKTFSFINIFGLSVGLTCCMLIALYLYDEFHYDRYQHNLKELYQVGTIFGGGANGEEKTVNTPSPMGPDLKLEFGEVEDMTRMMTLFNDDKTLLTYRPDGGSQQAFYEQKGCMADGSFFRMFTYNFIEGDAHTALNEPNSIVISSEIAKKIFGSAPALNKIIHVSSSTAGNLDLKITGVFKPIAQPSHIDKRFFISLNSGDWGEYIKTTTNMASNNMFYTYLQLKPSANPDLLQKKLPAFVEKYMSKDLKLAGFTKKQFLIPVKDIHLYQGLHSDANVTPTASVTNLYILASIAALILLIACINFMNLSTARSAKRAGEVGIRKVLGAEKASLIRQFLGESLLQTFLAFLLALGLVAILLPVLGRFSGKSLSLDISTHLPLFLGFVALALLSGIIAGSYPAFYLSSFQPIKVLKGKFANSLGAISFRKVLVVVQFIISIGLIIASVIMTRQMSFLRNTDLGFEKDQQLVIPMRSEQAKKIYATLKDELSNNSKVISVGASYYYPGIFNPSDMNFYKEGQTVNDGINIKMNYVDNSFMQTLGLKSVAGRLFSDKFPGDTSQRLVLNEAAVTKFSMKPEDAIGKTIAFDWQGQTYKFLIVGVLKNFHHESLKEPISPFGFQLSSQPFYNYIIAHVRASELSGLLASLQKTWQRLNPNEPFEYSFLDQDFQKNYEQQQRQFEMVRYFTIIAIVISCLGLFGLVTFSAEQRTKEIGIRKVLGASSIGIVNLMSKDFLKLVLIGNLIALPITYYIMNKWLQEFAYRTGMSWWLFVIAGASALLIALLTVSVQAIRAAWSNPVKSLRTE
jgi:putative ABC transport system permease protein